MKALPEFLSIWLLIIPAFGLDLDVIDKDALKSPDFSGCPEVRLNYSAIRIPYGSKFSVLEDGSWSCLLMGGVEVQAYRPSITSSKAGKTDDFVTGGVVMVGYMQASSILQSEQRRKRCSFSYGCDKIVFIPKQAIVKLDEESGFARVVVWGDGFSQVFDLWGIDENYKSQLIWLLHAILYSPDAVRQIGNLCPAGISLGIEKLKQPE